MSTFRDAYTRATKLETNIESAVKDESDTQQKYSTWIQTARTLGQTDPVFTAMVNTIEGIARQEKDHQARFQAMLSEITKAKGKIVTKWDEAETQKRIH